MSLNTRGPDDCPSCGERIEWDYDECPQCNGSKRYAGERCVWCGGKGEVRFALPCVGGCAEEDDQP